MIMAKPFKAAIQTNNIVGNDNICNYFVLNANDNLLQNQINVLLFVIHVNKLSIIKWDYFLNIKDRQ